MSIEEQFNLVAKEYDANRRNFIPCFDDYYKTATKIVLSTINKPKSVLDLGAGTGLLTYYWYLECNTANYTLVDVADAMLEISKKRFQNISTISHQTLDYTMNLPNKNYDTIISALSIHHLSNSQKKDLFAKLYDKLPENGVFVNYDQFCGGSKFLDKLFNDYWEQELYNTSLSEHDITMWRERQKLDKECTVVEEIEMLKAAQFKEVSCIYSYHKFSVIIAIK